MRQGFFPYAWLIGAACLAGCAAIPQDQKAMLLARPDCSQANEQIAGLGKIRPSGFKKITTMAGLASPSGLAGMVVHNDYQDRRKIITGGYGAEIDAKIAVIRTTCNQ